MVSPSSGREEGAEGWMGAGGGGGREGMRFGLRDPALVARFLALLEAFLGMSRRGGW